MSEGVVWILVVVVVGCLILLGKWMRDWLNRF